MLTVATDNPAYPPYFEDNDPTNGEGFESAVAYAIGDQLGYPKAKVKWTEESFNSSFAPGPKDFDFDVNQISITPVREKAVDFSAPYYTANQAVVALKSSDAARRNRWKNCRTPQLGVQVGTTSLEAAEAEIDPNSRPEVFNSSNDVVQALKNEQIDAVVVDLPTALYLTAVQVPEATVVGQFSAPGGDQWGALLEKDSALTACVSEAIEELESSGELEKITDRWMSQAAGAPELQLMPGRGSPIPPSDRRLEREAAKRRRHRRGQAIAAISSVVVLGGLATLILTSPGWPEVRETFFNWEVFKDSFPDVLEAFWLDVKIFLIAELAILAVGLLVAMVRIARSPAMFPVRLLSVVWVDLFRGIPTILLVFLIGFGVPALQLSGLPTDPVILGAIALVLSYSAYVAEVYRAGINSVHRGQRDAALAVGLTESQAMRHVILPQAVRRVAPPLLNDFVALQKDVALISILGPLEAFREAQIIESLTFNFTPLVAAALLYLAVTVPTARIVDRMGGPEGAVR